MAMSDKDRTPIIERRHPPPLCYGAASGRRYRFEFLRYFRVAYVVGVEIEGVDADAVFHFTLADDRAGTAATADIAPDLPRHAWREECGPHHRNP